MTARSLFFILVFFFSFQQMGHCQTCCSGGVPVSNEIGLPQGKKGNLMIYAAYDNNRLDQTYSGTEEVVNSLRSRDSKTYLLQTNYSLNSKSGVELLLPYITQRRIVTSVAGSDDITKTSGISDPVVLYKRLFTIDSLSESFITANLGLKLPFGETDKTTEDGRFVQADLQPGSGTFDQIILIQSAYSFKKRPVRKLLVNTSYINKTENNKYFENDSYKFGNVFQASAGFSEEFLTFSKIVQASILARYRDVQPDQLNNGELLNTGGQWVFIDPALTISMTEKIGIVTKMNFPVYTNVNGEQVSPNLRFSLGGLFRLSKKSNHQL